MPKQDQQPPPLTLQSKLGGKKQGFADPDKLQTEVTQNDIEGYQRSDADWNKRFPELNLGRNLDIQGVSDPLSGRGDPFLQKELTQTGLGGLYLGKNEFDQARNLGQPIASKEARDRNYFSKLINDNKERTFGLSSGDIENIAAVNSQGMNALNQGAIQGRLNRFSSDVAQNAQTTGAIASGIGTAIKTLGTNLFQPHGSGSPYLNAGQYATSFTPSMANNYFNAPGLSYNGPGGYEGTLDNMPVYAASPVAGQDYSGGGGGGGW